MKKLLQIFMALLVITAIACTKEGPQGPAGTNGTNGTDGNANVMYSDWFQSGTWSGASGAYYFNKSVPQITQSILDSSVVLTYAKLTSDGSNIRQLPANTTFSGVVLWNFILTVGNIQFTTNFTITPAASNEFRYVIIPATTHLRLSKPLTQMSYDEICTMFNIPK